MVVGHDAADEVGVGLVERGEQRVQLRPEAGGDGLVLLAVLALLLLLLRRLLGLPGVVAEQVHHEVVGGRLELVHHGVVQLILVLVEPVAEVGGRSSKRWQVS